VSTAMRHPVGVGNAKFHLGNHTGDVDTVYLGTFWKSTISRIGGFDPIAGPNEDAEFNLRLKAIRGRIYLDKSIVVVDRPRRTWPTFATQYFRYGMGRAYTVLKHKQISARQLASPLVVLSICLSVFLAPLFPYSVVLPIGYLAAMVLISLLSRDVDGLS